MAAAKEFNIGKDTLVDFLVSKGFEDEDMKPTSKLTEPMYRALQSEFQQDKVAHEKAMQIDLPKGASTSDSKKKRDEQDLSFNKKETKAKAKPVEEEKPVEVAAPEQTTAEPVKEIKKEEVKEEIKDVEKSPSVTKVKAPELETPKVLDKIDLDKIDSSTRPKKTTKKAAEKEERKKAAEPKKAKKAEAEKQKRIKAVEVKAEAEEIKEDTAPVIENIQAKKLSGPKIMGKIDLPVDNDTRPKKGSDEKRKRKRIPMEKKPGGQPGGAPGTQNRRPEEAQREPELQTEPVAEDLTGAALVQEPAAGKIK